MTDSEPYLVLAPMEGLVDPRIRDLLTRLGGYDLCVTEFVRVSQGILPPKVWYRLCPELKNHGKTAAGVPVLVQLMGHDEQVMAENAAYAAELGAPGIDINFGCPSKVVNKRSAGASLLKCPDNLYRIVSAIRAAVAANIPVSAKMRLGYADKSLFLENAQAAADGGAAHLTVHARTRLEGYKPPAHWEYIARVREALTIPVIANGDIWTRDDYMRCRGITGCDRFMLGRGAVAQPGLAIWIKTGVNPLDWAQTRRMINRYIDQMDRDGIPSANQPGRIKQWLKLMGQQSEEIAARFHHLRTCRDIREIRRQL